MNIPKSLRSLFSCQDEFAVQTFTGSDLVRVERHAYAEDGIDRSTFIYCTVVDGEKVYPNKSSHGAPFLVMDADISLIYGVNVDAAIWLPACLGCFSMQQLCVVAGVRLCQECATPKPEDEAVKQRILERFRQRWLDDECER